mmetsp:Transcript_86500/g.242178  ORF Transcript_86500/g.242178 Transcript_86500/m.242178 type:complete len:211 (-) Transcript_86500:1378-2010(-)
MDSQIVAAQMLKEALRPVKQGAPPQPLTGNGKVREVHERCPINAASALGPKLVAVGQVLHELVGDRWHENPVILWIDAEAVSETLEIRAVVDAKLEAARRAQKAVDEIDEIALSRPHHHVQSRVPKRAVETGEAVDSGLMRREPPFQLFASALGNGHWHVVCVSLREESSFDVFGVAEMVPELAVNVPRKSHRSVQLGIEARDNLTKAGP